jgi:hypothetical protein
MTTSERLCREADHTINEATARQKLQVIVVRAWDKLELLRVGGSFVQTPAVRRGHDLVLLAGNDQQRAPHAPDPLDRIEGVAQKETNDWQEWVVQAPMSASV